MQHTSRPQGPDPTIRPKNPSQSTILTACPTSQNRTNLASKKAPKNWALGAKVGCRILNRFSDQADAIGDFQHFAGETMGHYSEKLEIASTAIWLRIAAKLVTTKHHTQSLLT